MVIRREYQNFLRDFHPRFGCLQASSYQEWYYNTFGINSGNYVSLHVNPNPVRVPVSSFVTNTGTQNKTKITRALWTEAEEKLLIQSWSKNFEQLETVSKDEA